MNEKKLKVITLIEDTLRSFDGLEGTLVPYDTIIKMKAVTPKLKEIIEGLSRPDD